MAEPWRERRQGACCYSLDITALPPLPTTPPEDMPRRRARILRSLLRPRDKLRCLAGWLLMRRFLGPETGARLRYGRYGKPFLPGGPYFSLSHSGRYAVLAVAPTPVGVDVERVRADEDCAALATLALHPAERLLYARRPDARTFFALWTLKESYLKLRGTGLAEDPASFALALDGQGARLAERPDIGFHLYRQLPGYSLALCLYGGAPPATVIPVCL